MFINKNISIVIADDHPIMLKGLAEELVALGYNILGLAKNGAIAIQQITDLKPQIAILDVEMPLLSGFEVILKALELNCKTKFIIMTYHKEDGFIVQAKKCGANGYLLKEDGINDIQSCINQVLTGNFFYSPSLTNNIDKIIHEELRRLKLLTPSERSIIRLIQKGLNSKDISEQLSVSKRTVEKHRSNIISKLEIKNHANAIQDWLANHRELVKTL